MYLIWMQDPKQVLPESGLGVNYTSHVGQLIIGYCEGENWTNLVHELSDITVKDKKELSTAQANIKTKTTVHHENTSENAHKFHLNVGPQVGSPWQAGTWSCLHLTYQANHHKQENFKHISPSMFYQIKYIYGQFHSRTHQETKKNCIYIVQNVVKCFS